jgi:hypothetical protein
LWRRRCPSSAASPSRLASETLKTLIIPRKRLTLSHSLSPIYFSLPHFLLLFLQTLFVGAFAFHYYMIPMVKPYGNPMEGLHTVCFVSLPVRHLLSFFGACVTP